MIAQPGLCQTITRLIYDMTWLMTGFDGLKRKIPLILSDDLLFTSSLRFKPSRVEHEKSYSNALANITRRLIGQRQKLRQYILRYTVGNPTSWATSFVIGQRSYFTSLTQLTFCSKYVKVKRYIRMGITIFKIFIWGGISSDIRSEIMFYGSADESP